MCTTVSLAALALALTFAATAPAAKAQRTLHLELPATTSHYVDLGAKGYSSGDYFVTTGRVLALPGRTQAGRLGGIWTIQSRAADFADFDLGLTHGTLLVSGRIVHGARPSTLAVTAGTGMYAGAKGTVTLREGATTATLVIHLR